MSTKTEPLLYALSFVQQKKQVLLVLSSSTLEGTLRLKFFILHTSFRPKIILLSLYWGFLRYLFIVSFVFGVETNKQKLNAAYINLYSRSSQW